MKAIADRPTPAPMSVRAVAKCWECDAEFERDGPEGSHWVVFWEPLNCDAPPDARPYVYGTGQIDFYDCTGNRMIEKNILFHSLNSTFPHMLLMRDGVWREAMPGQVVYHDGRWQVRHRAASNTRMAAAMNAGWPAYQGRAER